MNQLKKTVTLDRLQTVAWILFLVFLPVTSFPFFPPEMGGDALVRPLSLFPLIVLVFIATFPALFRKRLPATFLSLLPFVLVATASSLLSLLHGINSTFGVSVAQRLMRAMITLGIGGAIYLTVALLPKTFNDLRAALRWIYAGLGIAMLWGSVQAFYVIHFNPAFYQWANHIQKFISTRRLIENRISGMTYEPNWFAEQISFLLIPWLIASVMSGYSVFRWRWRSLTVEWLLLGWAVGVLAFTFSRTGLIVLFTLVVVSVLFFRPNRVKQNGQKKAASKSWPRRISEALAAVFVIAGLVFLAGAKNEFFSRLWNYWTTEKKTSLAGYFDYLGFGARFIYSTTAFRIYEANPVIGVGLGNYAFYFEDMVPEQLIAETPEILRLLTQNVERFRLMTPKNLYMRILAETGLVGMAAFLVFILSIAGCAIFLYLSPQKEHKFWGMASIYLLIAFVLSALSYDSFTIPNMWVVFGMITAAAWISKRTPEPPQFLLTGGNNH
jgi:hypothetical protein